MSKLTVDDIIKVPMDKDALWACTGCVFYGGDEHRDKACGVHNGNNDLHLECKERYGGCISDNTIFVLKEELDPYIVFKITVKKVIGHHLVKMRVDLYKSSAYPDTGDEMLINDVSCMIIDVSSSKEVITLCPKRADQFIPNIITGEEYIISRECGEGSTEGLFPFKERTEGEEPTNEGTITKKDLDEGMEAIVNGIKEAEDNPEEKCWFCHGTGKMINGLKFIGNTLECPEVECTNCNGTGLVPKKKEEKQLTSCHTCPHVFIHTSHDLSLMSGFFKCKLSGNYSGYEGLDMMYGECPLKEDQDVTITKEDILQYRLQNGYIKLSDYLRALDSLENKDDTMKPGDSIHITLTEEDLAPNPLPKDFKRLKFIDPPKKEDTPFYKNKKVFESWLRQDEALKAPPSWKNNRFIPYWEQDDFNYFKQMNELANYYAEVPIQPEKPTPEDLETRIARLEEIIKKAGLDKDKYKLY